MEQQLLSAGFIKLDATEYQHPDGRKFYRDTRNTHRWYLKDKDGIAKPMGRLLGEAIRKVLEVRQDG